MFPCKPHHQRLIHTGSPGASGLLPQRGSSVSSEQAVQGFSSWNAESPETEILQPPLGLGPTQLFWRGKKGFSLSPSWASGISLCAAVSHTPSTHCCEKHSCMSFIPPGAEDAAVCSLQPSILSAEPVPMPQALLTGKGLQPHCLTGLP